MRTPVLIRPMTVTGFTANRKRGWYADVLDHGFVELIRWSPNDSPVALDLDVVNSARVSFMAESFEITAQEIAIIRAMMREHHGSPFEHQTFTFRVRCPLFVMREWHRHRTASISEASARYTIVPNLFYVPETEDMRSQVGKAIDYTYEPMDERLADGWRARLRKHHEDAFAEYEEAIEQGVAKEVARTFLPVAMYSEMRWTVNLRNLLGFLALRNAAPAQREIRAYAEVMERMLREVMPITAAAFEEFGRVKP